MALRERPCNPGHLSGPLELPRSGLTISTMTLVFLFHRSKEWPLPRMRAGYPLSELEKTRIRSAQKEVEHRELSSPARQETNRHLPLREWPERFAASVRSTRAKAE